MKKSLYGVTLWVLILCLGCFACSDGESPSLTFESTQDITFDSSVGQTKTVAFSSSGAWTATVGADWVTLSPAKGNGGVTTLRLTTTSENTTGKSRETSLTVSSGRQTQRIRIVQEASEIFRLEQTEYELAAAGDSVYIYFETNIPGDSVLIYRSQDDTWVTQDAEQLTKALMGYGVQLYALPNSGAARAASIYFVRLLPNGLERPLGIVTLYQAGRESTDYSMDKQVRTLQTATKGKGIPIVLMGDGFMDTDISDGTYDKVMEKTMENLFTEEPMTTLRDYFTIYQVYAVSKTSVFGLDSMTVFNCHFEGGESTAVEGDHVKVQEYACSVEDLDLANSLLVVVANTPVYAGTTYFGFYNEQETAYVDMSIAYCPVIDYLESESFRRVLVHEAVGHGFGKLTDEYSYEKNGEITEDEIKQTRKIQSLGWMQNVDFVPDSTEVLWSDLLLDARFDGEGLGVYEGGHTYVKGAYRPTKQSMMNGNIKGFNAPSRRSIYRNAMRLGLDKTITYEEFVAFDRSLPLSSSLRQARKETPSSGFALPRMARQSIHAFYH